MKARESRLASALLPAAAALFGALLWTLIIMRTHFKLEDAYITFRYCSNLVAGHGFVFNIGERVLGTTTPLQTLLLALLAYPFGPRSVPDVASAVMPVFGLLAGVFGYMAVVRRGIPAAAAAVGMLIVYTNVEMIRTGIGGMETPLALCLMALSLWALVSDRPVTTGILCGLLVLCRIDGLLWTALICAATFLKCRSDVLRLGAAFVLVLLPWVIFAKLYFGSPLPNSVLAKGVIRPGMQHALLNPARMMDYLRWYVEGTGTAWGWPTLPWALVLAVGARRILKQNPKELGVLVAFPPFYALAMYFGRSPRYEWYLLPITFCCLIIAGIGIYEMYRWAAARVFRDRMILGRYVGVGLALLVLAGYSARAVPAVVRHLRMAQENEDGFRRVVGLWLHDHTPANASAAMEGIGYQGYFSERRIIDMAGLVTPQAVEYKRRTSQNGQIFEWIRTELKPDYIVLRSFEVDTNKHFNGGKLFLTPEKERAFHRTYREAARFTAPYPDSAPLVRHLTVYERVPSDQ